MKRENSEKRMAECPFKKKKKLLLYVLEETFCSFHYIIPHNKCINEIHGQLDLSQLEPSWFTNNRLCTVRLYVLQSDIFSTTDT